MAKQTSLAARLSREAEDTARANEKENARVALQPAERGKVWVRLIRAHYDGNGKLHPAGITQLSANAVPKSAKVLTVAPVEPDAESED